MTSIEIKRAQITTSIEFKALVRKTAADPEAEPIAQWGLEGDEIATAAACALRWAKSAGHAGVMPAEPEQANYVCVLSLHIAENSDTGESAHVVKTDPAFYFNPV